MTWVQIPPEAVYFFFERRESELSQLVVLCCLALFGASQLHNHLPSNTDKMATDVEQEMNPLVQTTVPHVTIT